MNKQVIHELALATQQGKMTFLQVVKGLLEVGVESYLVDFATRQKTHYLSGGTTHTVPMILEPDPIPAEFNSDAIVAALSDAQADVIRYPEFVKRAVAAGVIGYWAFLIGKKVVYLGRNGEQYIREFPKAAAVKVRPLNLSSEQSRKDKMATISVTLSVQIACATAEAYRFVADPATMPQWAIHNVKSIRPLGSGEWEIGTPRGAGKLVPHYEQRFGILDHEFIDPKEGSWAVSARIVPAGAEDSVYMITLVKPPKMSNEAFRQGMPLVEEELQTMKRILERR